MEDDWTTAGAGKIESRSAAARTAPEDRNFDWSVGHRVAALQRNGRIVTRVQ
jgi:hypothetical protein